MNEPASTISLDRVVELVSARGHAAYVEHTGGGVMTVYAFRGPTVPHFADEKTNPWGVGDMPDVMVGPGSLSGDGNVGYLSDLYSGRTAVDAATMEWGADDYDTDHYRTMPTETAESLAAVVLCQLAKATRQFGPRP